MKTVSAKPTHSNLLTLCACLILCMCCALSAYAQSGIPVWPVVTGPYGNDATNPVAAQSISMSSGYPHTLSTISPVINVGTAAAQPGFDLCGRFIFYILQDGSSADNHLFLYTSNGIPIPLDGSTTIGLNGSRADAEMEVIAIPNTNPQQWYIIYSKNDADPYLPIPVLYSRIQFSGANAVHVVERDVVLLANGSLRTYTHGKALSRTSHSPGYAHDLYLCRRTASVNTISIDRFSLKSGPSPSIDWEVNSGDVASTWWGLTVQGSPIELSPTESKLAVIARHQDDDAENIYMFDATNVSTLPLLQTIKLSELLIKSDPDPSFAGVSFLHKPADIANANGATLGYLNNFERKIQDLEFSPNGNYLYITNGGYSVAGRSVITYLGQIDLTTSYPYTVALQTQNTPNENLTTGLGDSWPNAQDQNYLASHMVSEIQSSYDAKFYFTKTNSDTLYILPNPDAGWQYSSLKPTRLDYSTVGLPNVQTTGYVLKLPEQIDGFNYASSTDTCFGEIRGMKWHDLDGDGFHDSDEPGIADWHITITGAATGETVTNADGAYSFAPLAPGTYTVCEVMQNGWTPTTSSCQTVTVGNGQTVTVDFNNIACHSTIDTIQSAKLTVCDTTTQCVILSPSGLVNPPNGFSSTPLIVRLTSGFQGVDGDHLTMSTVLPGQLTFNGKSLPVTYSNTAMGWNTTGETSPTFLNIIDPKVPNSIPVDTCQNIYLYMGFTVCFTGNQTPGTYTGSMTLYNGSVSMSIPLAVTVVQCNSLCAGNLIVNGDFTQGFIPGHLGTGDGSHINNWSEAASTTPDLANLMGCNDSNYVAMWGNGRPSIGEGLQQMLPVPLVIGGNYTFSLCQKFVPVAGKMGYVRFKIIASVNPITQWNQGTVIGITPNTSSTSWTTVSLPVWNATQAYRFITIHPENNSTANNGDSTSHGAIDDICLVQQNPSPGSVIVNGLLHGSFGNVSLNPVNDSTLIVGSIGTTGFGGDGVSVHLPDSVTSFKAIYGLDTAVTLSDSAVIEQTVYGTVNGVPNTLVGSKYMMYLGNHQWEFGIASEPSLGGAPYTVEVYRNDTIVTSRQVTGTPKSYGGKSYQMLGVMMYSGLMFNTVHTSTTLTTTLPDGTVLTYTQTTDELSCEGGMVDHINFYGRFACVGVSDTATGDAVRFTTTGSAGNWAQGPMQIDFQLGGIPTLNIVSETYGASSKFAQSTVGVSTGWNLVSAPSVLRDMRATEVFPSGEGSAFGFVGGYKVADTLRLGRGYWQKFTSADSLQFSGVAVDSFAVPVVAGWNIVGSISTPVSTSSITSNPPGLSVSQFFGYNGGYFQATTLLPGKAYWVKCVAPGALNLSTGLFAAKAGVINIREISELPPAAPDAHASVQTTAPKSFALEQNYPNPFNPTTTFKYTLPVDANVRLTVYNVLGERVATLVDGVQSAGYRTITWNGQNAASGMYLYRLEAVSVAEPGMSFTKTMRMLLLK